jgi:hypothetical protein
MGEGRTGGPTQCRMTEPPSSVHLGGGFVFVVVALDSFKPRDES